MQLRDTFNSFVVVVVVVVVVFVPSIDAWIAANYLKMSTTYDTIAYDSIHIRNTS
jgi:hypothetical protein